MQDIPSLCLGIVLGQSAKGQFGQSALCKLWNPVVVLAVIFTANLPHVKSESKCNEANITKSHSGQSNFMVNLVPTKILSRQFRVPNKEGVFTCFTYTYLPILKGLKWYLIIIIIDNYCH